MLYTFKNAKFPVAVFVLKILFIDARSTQIIKERAVALDILDAMQHMMTGERQFDRNFYKNVTNCMKMFDPRLPAAHDAVWQGMSDYWDTRGAPDDSWGSFGQRYAEWNISVMQFKNMEIYEPCNSASNVAFYHSFLEMCNRYTFAKPFYLPDKYVTAISKSMSLFVATSFFYHGSMTTLGNQQDITSIAVITYLVYQGIFSLVPNKSPILNELNLVPRSLTGIEMSEKLIDMYVSVPSSQWYDATLALNIPDYNTTISGFIVFLLAMNLEPPFLHLIFQPLMNTFQLPQDVQIFMTTKYLPELLNVVSYFNIKVANRAFPLRETIATVAKFIYSMIFQEEVLFRGIIGNNPILNYIGSVLMKFVNIASNKLNNFSYYNKRYQLGRNVYPGEQYCQRYSHARWHVQSSIAMLDMAFVGDEIYRSLQIG